MYRLFVNDLEFYAFHGVPVEERKVGHRYRVSISVEVDGRATQTDRVEDTIDYAQIAQLVNEVSEQKQVQTVERLAQTIAEAILAKFKKAESVQVALEKRLPPAPIMAESAGVEVELHRH